MNECWILSFDNGMNTRAFSTKEKAENALREHLSEIEVLSDLSHNSIDEDFEYWTYRNDFEYVEACIERVKIEE